MSPPVPTAEAIDAAHATYKFRVWLSFAIISTVIFALMIVGVIWLWCDNIPTNDGNAAIIISICTSFIAGLTLLVKNQLGIQDSNVAQHKATNSRLDEFMLMARKAAYAEGKLEGQSHPEIPQDVNVVNPIEIKK